MFYDVGFVRTVTHATTVIVNKICFIYEIIRSLGKSCTAGGHLSFPVMPK